jgi:hypothetical protein
MEFQTDLEGFKPVILLSFFTVIKKEHCEENHKQKFDISRDQYFHILGQVFPHPGTSTSSPGDQNLHIWGSVIPNLGTSISTSGDQDFHIRGPGLPHLGARICTSRDQYVHIWGPVLPHQGTSTSNAISVSSTLLTMKI